MKDSAPLQKQQTPITTADNKAVLNPLQLKTDAAITPITIKQNPLQLFVDKPARPNNNPLRLQSKKENKTGSPDKLKENTVALSGYSMDDVEVHYNSDKPEQLQALAYAQGSEIHVAPGQEKHLHHEAGHVVQQREGRVKKNVLKEEQVPVNNDSKPEADVMGRKAIESNSQPVQLQKNKKERKREHDRVFVSRSNGSENEEESGFDHETEREVSENAGINFVEMESKELGDHDMGKRKKTH